VEFKGTSAKKESNNLNRRKCRQSKCRKKECRKLSEFVPRTGDGKKRRAADHVPDVKQEKTVRIVPSRWDLHVRWDTRLRLCQTTKKTKGETKSERKSVKKGRNHVCGGRITGIRRRRGDRGKSELVTHVR